MRAVAELCACVCLRRGEGPGKREGRDWVGECRIKVQASTREEREWDWEWEGGEASRRGVGVGVGKHRPALTMTSQYIVMRWRRSGMCDRCLREL